MKSLINSLVIIIIIGLVAMIILDMHNNNNKNNNKIVNKFEDISYEKNRTLLYGSLFLDNLNKQIKNMTDPRITYDNKRIDIVKYSDVLL